MTTPMIIDLAKRAKWFAQTEEYISFGMQHGVNQITYTIDKARGEYSSRFSQSGGAESMDIPRPTEATPEQILAALKQAGGKDITTIEVE
jgi:hypothetical protein